MNLSTWYNKIPKGERSKTVEALGFNADYIYQLAASKRAPSVKLCRQLVKKIPQLKLSDLRADVWDSD